MEPPPNPPPLGPSILTGIPPRVYPLWGTVSSLAHSPVSGFDTICNGLDPPLADIVLFGLSLSGFPSRLKNVSGRERFPHPYILINGGLFSSPSMWDITTNEDVGPSRGWIVRSHIRWRGKRNIPYKGVKTSS